MNDIKSYFIPISLIICVIIALYILYKLLKSPSPLWNALKSALGGVTVLLILNLFSEFNNVYIPVSLMNLGVCSLAGIPGVCMLLICQIIFSH